MPISAVSLNFLREEMFLFLFCQLDNSFNFKILQVVNNFSEFLLLFLGETILFNS